MPTELFANNPSTTLASSALSGDATISVTSSTGFPAAVTGTSQFRILVESEIMLVTNVSGTTWTVTRGSESTTAAAHSAGVAVTHVVTAAALTGLTQSGAVIADTQLPVRLRAGVTNVSNVDTITDQGWYCPAPNATGLPTDGTIQTTSYSMVEYFGDSSNGVMTLDFWLDGDPTTNTHKWKRYRRTGSWGSWFRVEDGYTILTNASNLASGTVPSARIRPTSLWNGSVTTPAAGFAADTYLVGSSISVPASSLQAKTQYRLKFSVSKTGAGTATPIINIRFGTAGSTADTSVCALTFAAQTAVIDEGFIEVFATFRTVGSGTSAVVQGVGTLTHRLASTGLSTSGTSVVTTTGGGFDSTVSNAIIGCSVNGGTSAAWTITLVQAELYNLV